MSRRILVCAALALCLVLTACGGTDPTEGNMSLSDILLPEEAAPAPAPEPEAPPPVEEPEAPVEEPEEIPPEEPEEPEEEPSEEEPQIDVPPIDAAGLQAALEAELATCTGDWALYWKCLETGDTISIGSQQMTAASLIKLYVAGAYFDALRQGKVTEAPETVRTMISDSSNEACNQLIDALGGMEAVNQFAAGIGCNDSQLNRKMLAPSPPENYTSVEDCGKVLEMIYAGTYVDEDASTELMTYLRQQTRAWKIPAGVPAGTMTANKTGELAGVENDAAIVWSPTYTYILCVMSDNILSADAGQSNIAGLSRIVYEFLEDG